ncbi:copper resistance CopC family protein [Sciscionella marina]|uniref:copper resistance CopC family protein n=1 Tax=Sciscionella marina TaxID=508770 RepID=UPI00036EF410|nr:copper resistance CopC family protein [Sciscionella marina]
MKRALLLAALVLGLTGLTAPAFAHNTFVGSSPGNGATVGSSPKQVSVTFGEPVQQGENRISVLGPDGHSQWQAQRLATVDGDSVRVPLRELGPAGRYTIAYRVISADGHPVSGTATFTLSAPGHGTPAAPEQAGQSDTGGGVPVWVWAVGVVVLLAVAIGLALRLTRPVRK